MTKEFNKKTVNKWCYKNLDKFPDILDINGIIDLPIPLKDKFWFIYKNCNLSYNEMQILNLNLAKVNIAHYKETRQELALPEIIKITELHESFVIKLINENSADRAAYIAAFLAEDRAADCAAYLAVDLAADRVAFLAAYLAAYYAPENKIFEMLKSFFVNPIIIQL